MTDRSRRDDTSRAVSWSDSGERPSVVELRLPPPQPDAARRARAAPCDDQEQGHGRAPVEQVLEELEQAIVGPVQVLDHEDARARAASASRNRRQAVNASSRPTSRRLVPRADERRQPGPIHARSASSVGESRDGRVELRRGLGGIVGLEDARLGLHDLAERPERDALAVGQAAPWRQRTRSGRSSMPRANSR